MEGYCTAHTRHRRFPYRRRRARIDYDVTTAAYAVGYESLSHFSREYTRMFGESPKRDITELRKSAGKL
ncbi:helix-turn-helix domain-containing protein [Klebsiella pneumoniae]|uniref:helix-turn-helix domain-containing protein n=1 Tax=Klebsiella pneumoniae TaxID=573 RepID=UPI0009407681|nr:AraC family transcriptional regulator [Klebsiella pneumoniae]TYD60428.1 AraC family transcriptional regulator [Klebsiella pneumoniae]TYD65078.1 AraC family transcriptional regulator [Klebsiella pneumoniae]TYD65255.1 AraC family transcriptional regulator [Klebsiella pneumoniae]TYE28816.1 AraC family transcriptional regulator [Klebsiella pneumoniae]